ncbi:MAG: hypothetical protein LBT62_02785 [Deltaproteobacteria bacterium]|nr:hypothetical protein [Deltaproteobacteria bacterium]
MSNSDITKKYKSNTIKSFIKYLKELNILNIYEIKIEDAQNYIDRRTDISLSGKKSIKLILREAINWMNTNKIISFNELQTFPKIIT